MSKLNTKPLHFFLQSIILLGNHGPILVARYNIEEARRHFFIAETISLVCLVGQLRRFSRFWLLNRTKWLHWETGHVKSFIHSIIYSDEDSKLEPCCRAIKLQIMYFCSEVDGCPTNLPDSDLLAVYDESMCYHFVHRQESWVEARSMCHRVSTCVVYGFKI